MAKIPNKINYVVDFETYYDTKMGPSAKSTGVQNYVKQSYAYMMSVAGPGLQWVGTIEEARRKFTSEFWEHEDHEFWAANSNFDQAWAQHVWELPRIKPWRCILDLGATQQMPQSLDQLVRVLFRRKVDKSVREFMDGKHYRDLSEDDQKRVLNYCMQDSIEEMEALEYLPDASDFEDDVALLTRQQNRTGVHIDMDLLEQDRTRIMEHRHNEYQKIPWVLSGEAPLSYDQFRSWCNERGINPPLSFKEKDNPECDMLMNHNPEFAAILNAQRGFKKANLLVKKIDSIQARVTDQGTMPLEMMYCGARHTRRWSSRGVNVQNLNKEPLIVDPVEGWNQFTLLEALNSGAPVPEELKYVYPRHWFVPPPGKTFLILDYAQIEPRCLNWIAGNDTLLEYIRSGFSVYEAYARSVGAWSGNEPLKTGNPDLYKSVKAEVLGLGYGMGWKRYQMFNNVDETAAKLAVARFRSKNPMIPDLWKSFDADIKNCILDRSRTIDIEMPNGEWLRHFDLKMTFSKEEGGYKKANYQSLTIQDTPGNESVVFNLWGGVLTENVTQRMARDVMALGLVNLVKAGFQIAFSSHDEAILVIDDDKDKENAKEQAVRILCESPPWAPDLPLEVEGDFMPRYTKI
jgi:DNA polymerase